MITSFDSLQMDYSKHPAFSPYVSKGSQFDEAAIKSQLRQVDAEFFKIASQKQPSFNTIKSLFRKNVEPALARLNTLVEPKLDSNELRDLWGKSLEEASRQLLKDLRYRNRLHTYTMTPPPTGAGPTAEWSAKLNRDGYAVIPPIAKRSESIVSEGLKFRDQLYELHLQKPNGRAAIAISREQVLWGQVTSLFQDEGIISVVNNYQKCPQEIQHLSLELSTPKQTWYKNCYADVGVQTSKTAYMHYDYDEKNFKAMVYINDVAKENGAFHYIKGSHLWERSITHTWLQREIDFKADVVFGYDESGFYRRLWSEPTLRPYFLKLPQTFQGSSHFGDDLTDDLEISQELLQIEQPLTGKAGSLVIFDGGRGLHRGGLVNTGERIAIQVIFQPTDDRSLTEKVADKCARAVKKAKNLLHL